MKLIIEDEEGRKTVVPFVREEISIGRQEGNTIRLTERNVSRKHARLLRKNGSVVVEDLGSFNGVKVNGDRIEGKLPIQEGDLIEIGDYDLAIENDATDAATPPPAGEAAAEPAPNGRGKTERIDGRGRTEPMGGGHAVVTPATGRAPTDPDPAFKEAAAAARPQATAATAVIRPEALAAQAREVRDLPAAEQPKLVIVSGPQAGQSAKVERSEFRIGRTSGDNNLAINHRSISRNHAKVIADAEGTWRVLDLQSANGVRVNGEDYADAPLAPGDILELGHVRMRFVGPGESYTYVPDEERTPTPIARPGQLPGASPALIRNIGIGAAALVVVAGGGYFLLSGGSKPAPPPARFADKETSVPVAVAPATPHPALPAAPPKVAAPSPPAPPPPIEEATPPPGEIVQAPKASHPKEKHEREPKHHKAEPAEPAEAAAPAEPAPKADRHTRALAGYKDAVDLMQGGDYPGAVVKLQKVLGIDSNLAEAHKALGICYAKLKEFDKGAAHYEQYLKLKPNAPDAATVRGMLAQYYKSRGSQ